MTQNKKQNINIGAGVDDGTGHYLRKGGQIINHNIDNIYERLGDGVKLFTSGAWHNVSLKDLGTDKIYKAEFGDAIIADTRNGSYEIHLPKGSDNDVGQTIKIKDSFGSWAGKSIRIKSAVGDTIKGNSKVIVIKKNLLNITLEYTKSGRWEYNESVYLDKVTTGNTRTTMSNEYLVNTATQKNFPNVFDGLEYNKDNLEVYRRGNKLYYGDEFTENSEYGSLDSSGRLVALDGVSVALREPANKGDSLFFKSYTGNIEENRSTYNSGSISIRFKDEFLEHDIGNQEGILLLDREEIYNNIEGGVPTVDIPFSKFGVDVFETVNSASMDVYRNGILLLKSGEAQSFGYHCVGGKGNNKHTCELDGGVWTMDEENSDYNILFDGAIPVGIRFYTEIDDYDIITIKWLNNVIGTTVSMDDIHNEMSNNFIHSSDTFFVSKGISLSDIDDPTQNSVVHIGGEKELKPSGVLDIINLLYPVGTMYMNALNKENPKYILGFGEWRRMGGRVVAGFMEDDPIYGLNNNHKDTTGKPSKTTGGTYGSNNIKLNIKNLPKMQRDGKFLMRDQNGPYTFGACMIDPSEESEILEKFAEHEIIINDGITQNNVDPISVIQPTVIVSMWMRVK